MATRFVGGDGLPAMKGEEGAAVCALTHAGVA